MMSSSVENARISIMYRMFIWGIFFVAITFACRFVIYVKPSKALNTTNNYFGVNETLKNCEQKNIITKI